MHLTPDQRDWYLRRDNLCCNFNHIQSGPHEFFCRENYFDPFFISYTPFFGLLETFVPIQFRFITLCKHHFSLLVRAGYHPEFERNLYRIARINTLYYEIHAPEDVYPK